MAVYNYNYLNKIDGYLWGLKYLAAMKKQEWVSEWVSVVGQAIVCGS